MSSKDIKLEFSQTSDEITKSFAFTRELSVAMSKELYNLIRSVKSIEEVTTLDQIFDGLIQYICEKKLYDPDNPARVLCENDELEIVFGVSHFEIFDARKFLEKMIIPVNEDSKKNSDESSPETSSNTAQKRKSEDPRNNGQKRSCMIASSASPMILYVPPSPERWENISDTSYSMQGYETAVVEDSSDDLYQNNDGFYDGEVFAVEETFDLEYEIESDEVSSDVTDTETDIEDYLKTTIIKFACRTDSDVEFWADDSSEDEFDEEISEFDQWKCNKCGSLNKPPMRYCKKCWDERLGWLPERTERRPRKRKHKTKNKTPHFISSKKSEASSSELGSLSQEHSSQETYSQSSAVDKDSDEVKNICLLCCSKPSNATIIHGKYGHQISCYRCARQLQSKRKPCPICRRSIDRVVHQITAE